MSDAFRETAPRLLALAARALGWRPDEFWAATPEELAQALADPTHVSVAGLSRTDLARMMERDRDG
ncbi:phage tail assembly chaperone [Erythrobacter sp. 3-20A1M]|uniref:phage tail assembly chaperone n=1 Tax=Erythrobacter sp. 3-20A1M TaxID=2653850 RepID=UPI001BFC38C8|nr:phage tail assembly chaperone [Erythrobacter sp. 3-20A1M]QWC56928.1 phage tail assembly chaperone [Erythrobacter sp. 3-20A1M]